MIINNVASLEQTAVKLSGAKISCSTTMGTAPASVLNDLTPAVQN